jgi:hypothetical protein
VQRGSEIARRGAQARSQKDLLAKLSELCGEFICTENPREAINRAFHDRGIKPARGQWGCSTPFGNSSDFPRSKLRGLLN